MDRESHYRAHAITPLEPAGSASHMSDRHRLLEIDEEGRYLAGRAPEASRWQHPLMRSIEARRRKA